MYLSLISSIHPLNSIHQPGSRKFLIDQQRGHQNQLEVALEPKLGQVIYHEIT